MATLRETAYLTYRDPTTGITHAVKQVGMPLDIGKVFRPLRVCDQVYLAPQLLSPAGIAVTCFRCLLDQRPWIPCVDKDGIVHMLLSHIANVLQTFQPPRLYVTVCGDYTSEALPTEDLTITCHQCRRQTS